jgi:hypothetical protein
MATPGVAISRAERATPRCVVITAIGHDFRRVLSWLRSLVRLILLALWQAFAATPAAKWAWRRF